MENKYQYKIGQSIMLNESFDLFNINTWLNPFVLFFVNLYHKARGVEYVPYSHMIFVSEYKGELYAWEAVKDGFIPTKPIEERLKGIDHLVLTPYFNFNPEDAIIECMRLIGTPYDFAGVARQAIFRVFRSWQEINDKTASKKFYCNEINAYIYHQIAGVFDQVWKNMAHPEFYFSNLFKKDYINKNGYKYEKFNGKN